MLLVAGPGLALDAYTAGTVVGSLVPIGLGVWLILLGVRRRRVAPSPTWSYSGPAPTAAEGEVHSWNEPAPPPDPFPAVEPVPRRRGTWLILAGGGLVVVALLASVARLGSARIPDRRVVLPTSVLGLAINQQQTTAFAKPFLSRAPGDLKEPQAAVYGTFSQGILVLAGRTSTLRPESQVDAFRRGLEGAGGALTNGRDVAPGPLGGAARCWDGTIGAAKPAVCVYVDGGSLLATIDSLGGGLDAAAKRGSQIRIQTVHEA